MEYTGQNQGRHVMTSCYDISGRRRIAGWYQLTALNTTPTCSSVNMTLTSTTASCQSCVARAPSCVTRTSSGSMMVSGNLNSLTPGRFKVNFRWVIFKLILVVNGWGISCETALIWVSLDHTYDKSTLVQVMAWCRQATSYYLSQCWPRSLSPYD